MPRYEAVEQGEATALERALAHHHGDAASSEDDSGSRKEQGMMDSAADASTTLPLATTKAWSPQWREASVLVELAS